MLSLPRLIALVLVLVVVENAVLLHMAVGPVIGIRSSAVALVAVWLWLLLVTVATIGLAAQRRWGAYVLILLAPVSTIMMSIPLVPLVVRVAPVAYRPYLMTVVNILMLLAALIVMRRLPGGRVSPLRQAN